MKTNKFLSLLLITIIFSCTEIEQQPFSFVQLCDTQLGMGGYTDDIERFEQAVKQINDLDVDFAVICGDLVHHAADSSFSDFLRIKSGFRIPCYVAAGNHDIGKVPDSASLSYYRQIIGNDYYEFFNKGYSFIVVNTQLWKAAVENESEKHDDWFKETLKAQRSEHYPVFVVGHYPIFIKSPEEEDEYFNLPLNKRMELLALFKENNVKAYLSGHKHELLINKYENIQMVSGETTSKNFDKRPFGFRLWDVTPDTIKHSFVPLELLNIEQDTAEKH